MELLVIIVWLILSFLVASAGSNKNIGYWGAFFLSLIFSPLIGLIFALASSPKKDTPKWNHEVAKLTRLALIEHKNGNYNQALTISLQALEHDARNPVTHYNIAGLYSLLQNEQKCMLHLQRAFEFGFTDTKKLATSTDLQWIKQQPAYETFIQNGYKL